MLSDVSLFKGVTVRVLRPSAAGIDALGNAVAGWAGEDVANVLPDPSATADEAADMRPDATARTVIFRFPKTYAQPMRGCRIQWDGETYEVVGDPKPRPVALTPGPWNYDVEGRLVRG